MHQQAIINAGKFVLHNGEIEAVGAVAGGAAQRVAAITLYLGINRIVDDIIGGCTPPTPIDVTAINNSIDNNVINLNNLSS